MGLLESIKNIMSIPEEDEFDEEMEEKEQQSKSNDEESYSQKKSETPRIVKSKTVNYNAASQMQVVLVKPDRFEDVRAIADHLNERKTVVLNLEAADKDVARRIVDFLSGAAYANHGDMKKVANSTFMIAARGVDVMGELMLDDFDENKFYF